MNQREIKQRAFQELAGIISEMEPPLDFEPEDDRRWQMICSDLFAEFRRRGGRPVSVTTHVEGQMAIEVPE